MPEKLAETQERERASWQYRMVKHLRGNQTLTGALLLAILAKAPSNPPRILSGGVIGENGEVMTTWESRKFPGKALTISLGPIDALRDSFRAHCDTLNFTDAERTEIFDEFRRWIITDFRQAPNLLPDIKH